MFLIRLCLNLVVPCLSKERILRASTSLRFEELEEIASCLKPIIRYVLNQRLLFLRKFLVIDVHRLSNISWSYLTIDLLCGLHLFWLWLCASLPLRFVWSNCWSFSSRENWIRSSNLNCCFLKVCIRERLRLRRTARELRLIFIDLFLHEFLQRSCLFLFLELSKLWLLTVNLLKKDRGLLWTDHHFALIDRMMYLHWRLNLSVSNL